MPPHPHPHPHPHPPPNHNHPPEQDAAFSREHERLRQLLKEGGRGNDDSGNGTQTPPSHDGVPRYVRVRPGGDDKEEQETHQALVAAGGQAVTWCPGSSSFYSLPSTFRLAQWPLYQQGRVYGMDVASAVSVWALDPQPGENVLDLCCCPGLKLCMMADTMQQRGTVTGVDISRTRLTVCRQVLVKYQIGRPSPSSPAAPPGGEEKALVASSSLVFPSSWCRLLCADGCSFTTGPSDAWKGPVEDVVFDSRAYDWQGMEARGQKRMNRGTRKKESLALRDILSPAAASKGPQGLDTAQPTSLYDRVLVDADCTHDGSTRHMDKVAAMDEAIKTRRGGFLSREKLAGLEALQQGLLLNGFRLLRPGGVLVYSTCSLSPRQNEAIVQYLLQQEPDAAILDPITELGQPLYAGMSTTTSTADEEKDEEKSSAAPPAPAASRPRPAISAGPRQLPCQWGSLPGTLLFDPCFGETSGLFIARIKKKQMW